LLCLSLLKAISGAEPFEPGERPDGTHSKAETREDGRNPPAADAAFRSAPGRKLAVAAFYTDLPGMQGKGGAKLGNSGVYKDFSDLQCLETIGLNPVPLQ
jgi:hypothetical protein